MVKKPESSRVPSAVGAIPVVGGLIKQAETQAQWMQDTVEQNARLIASLPATMKTLNDSLERFNQTVGRLDRAVSRIESASKNLIGPAERLVGLLDANSVRDLPETLDVIRREAVPALRAATDTQRQVALLQTTVEHVISVISELPGLGILRRIVGGRADEATAPPAASGPGPGIDPTA